MKHLEISLKSPSSGMLLLHTGLAPNARKQQQSQQWLARLGELTYSHALALLSSPESGLVSRDRQVMEILIHLKDVAGPQVFFENPEWANLTITVSERVLSQLAPSQTNPNPVDRVEDAQPKLSPLRILYEVYLAYYQQDQQQCPYKDDFIRVRTELAKCLFALNENGALETILRKNKECNTAPLWRILVNQQVSFGWKKEAAKSCMKMATFADQNGLSALATTSREEALTLDINIKVDGTEFASMTFMTKEELRLATREEIVGDFLRDPHNQHNYEHLVDFLEDEGSVVNAVRVIVAHSLTKNVPAQYQANTAMPLRRLVTLISHLQSKYIPQLQILATEANHHRQEKGQEPLNPPDLQSLLQQAQHEEEYRSVTVSILETIAKKISPPTLSGSIPVPVTSSAFSSGVSSSPSSSPQSPPTALPGNVSPTQQRAAQRSSWGVKPGQGKDRNKRFTMGIKTQSNNFLGSRSAEFLSQPVTSNFHTSSSSTTDPNAKTPGPGRPPANFVWGPNQSVRLAPPPTNVENPIFSQPLIPPGRLHTPSTLTPFDPVAAEQMDGNGNGNQFSVGFQPQQAGTAYVPEDSPFSNTVFNDMPDQLSSATMAVQVPPTPSTNHHEPDDDMPPPAPEDDHPHHSSHGFTSAHPANPAGGNVLQSSNSMLLNNGFPSHSSGMINSASVQSLNASNSSLGSSTSSIPGSSSFTGGSGLPAAASLLGPGNHMLNSSGGISSPAPMLGSAAGGLGGSNSSLLMPPATLLVGGGGGGGSNSNTMTTITTPQSMPLGSALLSTSSTVSTMPNTPTRTLSPLTGPSLTGLGSPLTPPFAQMPYSTSPTPSFGGSGFHTGNSSAFGNPALAMTNPALSGGGSNGSGSGSSGLLPAASLANPYSPQSTPPTGTMQYGWSAQTATSVPAATGNQNATLAFNPALYLAPKPQYLPPPPFVMILKCTY
jgi:hypothetical protein